MHLLHATSLSFEMHFICERQSVDNGIGIYIQTHFLPSTGYCTTALASMILLISTCRSNASQQAFRARSPSPAASVALILLALVPNTRWCRQSMAVYKRMPGIRWMDG